MKEKNSNKPLAILKVRLIQVFGSGGWMLTTTILIIASLVLLCSYLWQQFGDQIVNPAAYALRPERLNVSEQPDWIQTDVKKNAIERGRLHGADIRDAKICERIGRAFLGSPWVKNVRYVNKSTAITTGINVSVEYRRPIAWVKVDATPYNVQFEKGIFPIDIHGVLLPPHHFDKDAANAYPKINKVNTYPRGLSGEKWGDFRVVEAAEIVDYLAPIWKQRDLFQIDVPNTASKHANTGDYVLVTTNGTRYVWGSAIGSERAGEPAAKTKLARLNDELQIKRRLQTTKIVDLTVARWASHESTMRR